jgi:hypothetical protein
MGRIRMFGKFRYPYWFLVGWGIAWVLSWVLLVHDTRVLGATANPDARAVLERTTLGKLPPMSAAGAIEVTGEAVKALGFDPSVQWEAGDLPAAILKLGVLDEAFDLGKLSLDKIGGEIGQNLSGVALSAFGPAAGSTLKELAGIVPGLSGRSIGSLSVVKNLLKANGYDPDGVLGGTVGQLMKAYPALGNLKLDSIDLSEYSIGSLPGLSEVALQMFSNWKGLSVSSVPGLVSMAFSAFPSPPVLDGGGVATVDLVLAENEHPIDRTVSGSDRAGFSVDCDRDCAHVELGGNPLMAGRRWVSGKYQKVKGGFGVLGATFGGQEPTGRMVFKKIKTVVWETDESSDTVSTALFFRVCKRGIPDLGCTPYGFGPLPFLTHRVGDWMLTG